MPHGQKTKDMKQKQYCSKFNKDFKNMVHIKKSLKKNYSPTFLLSNIWKFLSPILFSFQLIQLYYSPSSSVLAMPGIKGFALASPQNWNPEIMLYTKAIKIISFGGQYFLILSSVSILFSFNLDFTCFLFITRVFLCPSSVLSLPSVLPCI